MNTITVSNEELATAPLSDELVKITKRIWDNIPAREKFLDTDSGAIAKKRALLKGASGQGHKWVEVSWKN